MILLDFNQVSLAAIAMENSRKDSTGFDQDMARHFILNSIRNLNSKFGPQYGEMVIICDEGKSWRRDEFEFYKASRRKAQADEESAKQWQEIYSALNEVRLSMKTLFPFKTYFSYGLEADDIIAVMTKEGSRKPTEDFFGDMGGIPSEKILIISGDKDFQQLHVFAGVSQYSPTLKKLIKCEETPTAFLHRHILIGDVGDGIPNMLSDDDIFVSDQRQKSVTQPISNAWMGYVDRVKDFFEDYADGKILPSLKNRISVENLMKNYRRNKKLIDLINLPDHVIEKVHTIIAEPQTGNIESVRKYMIEKRLRMLSDSLQDFRLHT